MGIRRQSLMLVSLFGLSLAANGAAGAPANEIEAGIAYDRLTNGLPEWWREYLEALHRFDTRQLVYGGLQHAERFRRDDTEIYGGAYQPLGPATTVSGEATAGATHDIFPEWSLFGQVAQTLPRGWGVQLGLRHRAYRGATVDIGSLILERYWGAYRGAYTYALADLEGETAGSHRLQLNYYYGDRSTVGVSYATGRELESAGTPVVLIYDVTYYGLSGRHWLNDRWAMSYAVEVNEQGDSYRRMEFTLGVRRAF
nr:hypothetical protein [uncultured bacterium]